MSAGQGSEAGIAATWWSWARPLGGAAILGVLVLQLGTGTFVGAVREVDGLALVVGTAVASLTTAAAALRWRVVARQLHVELSLPAALAACYRAQFLNVILPGGVLGDLDRGVHHGRATHNFGRGVRSVAWERSCGQLVLVVLTVAALLVGGPFDSLALLGSAVAVVGVGIVVLRVGRSANRGLTGPAWRLARVVTADVRGVTGVAVTSILGASVVVVAGHVATFLLAARTVGVRMPVSDFVPLALLVLLVAALPLNLAGWGPREGAAAWAFGAVGFTASQGVAVAVAYGVIVVVATLPGAALLLVGRSRGPTAPAAVAREVVTHD